MHWLVNLAIYQLCWFICVIGGNSYFWLAVPLLGLHLVFTDKRKADMALMAVFLVVGIVVDGSLKFFGFFTFTSDFVILPPWLALIWLAFATLPNHSLSWMLSRPLLSILFGFMGGPLAYWAGAKLGAASFALPLVESLLGLGLLWSVLWPLLMQVCKRINAYTEIDFSGSVRG
jgi:hypothetical protein